MKRYIPNFPLLLQHTSVRWRVNAVRMAAGFANALTGMLACLVLASFLVSGAPLVKVSHLRIDSIPMQCNLAYREMLNLQLAYQFFDEQGTATIELPLHLPQVVYQLNYLTSLHLPLVRQSAVELPSTSVWQ